MINIRPIANRMVQPVNKDVDAVISRSIGSTTNEDGSRTPNYVDFPITVQIQALGYKDLVQIDGLNLNGARRAIYVNGVVSGVIRAKQQGGDLITFQPGLLPEADTWLVVQVTEQWSTWAKFVITAQNET